jgi:hypothetical protein
VEARAGSLPPTTILVDNFESLTSPAPWQFYNGSEYPGATGSLTLGTGYSGHGAHLAYDFSKGGRYVEAYLSLPTPVASAAFASFWVKSPATILLRLRVVDSTGQIFQYMLNRPLDTVDFTAWYQQVVDLDHPFNFWFGAADGVIHYPLKQIGVLAGDPVAPGLIGAIDFDDVYLLPASTLIDNFESLTSPERPAPSRSAPAIPAMAPTSLMIFPRVATMWRPICPYLHPSPPPLRSAFGPSLRRIFAYDYGRWIQPGKYFNTFSAGHYMPQTSMPGINRWLNLTTLLLFGSAPRME